MTSASTLANAEQTQAIDATDTGSNAAPSPATTYPAWYDPRAKASTTEQAKDELWRLVQAAGPIDPNELFSESNHQLLAAIAQLKADCQIHVSC